MEDTKQFPNGFDSWQETHFEIVSAITDARNLNDDQQPALIRQINDTQGTGGFYELAEKLTDKFEAEYAGADWDDSEYWESMEGFIGKEIYSVPPVVNETVTKTLDIKCMEDLLIAINEGATVRWSTDSWIVSVKDGTIYAQHEGTDHPVELVNHGITFKYLYI